TVDEIVSGPSPVSRPWPAIASWLVMVLTLATVSGPNVRGLSTVSAQPIPISAMLDRRRGIAGAAGRGQSCCPQTTDGAGSPEPGTPQFCRALQAACQSTPKRCAI